MLTQLVGLAPDSQNWALVSQQDLNDGGGPYSSVAFDSLTLDNKYLFVGRNIKAASSVSVKIWAVFRSSGVDTTHTVQWTSSGYVVSSVPGGSTVSDTVTATYLPMNIDEDNELLNHANVNYNDLWGLNFDMFMELGDQGTSDNQGIAVWNKSSGMELLSSSVPIAGCATHPSVTTNETPANQIDGIRFYLSTNSYAEVAGAAISCYRYTGSVL